MTWTRSLYFILATLCIAWTAQHVIDRWQVAEAWRVCVGMALIVGPFVMGGAAEEIRWDNT